MNYKYLFKTLILVFLCLLITARANIITVTNTEDDGPGSLRQAIIEADTSAIADTILFNIPTSDPGYKAANGVWTIQPAGELPYLLGDSTFIDGNSQSTNQGDSNPDGPEIEIDGTNIDGNGFRIEGSANKILGLIINRFSEYGIMIFTSEAKNNSIAGNYIGTDASGETALGNILGGILISGNSEGNVIGGLSPANRNVISGSSHRGNIYQGNGITIKGGNQNTIIGNYIGTNKDGTAALPNILYGICLTFAQENVIGGLEQGAGNVISGNNYGGIFIRFPETTNNTFIGNMIGTDASGLLNLGNFHEGIYLDYGTKNNVIGPYNLIKNNGSYGIIVRHDSTLDNQITQNFISNHTVLGIFSDEGGNAALTPPTIQEVTANYVSGTACPNCIVEIFSDSSDEGSIYEGKVNADASGDFVWSGTPSGPNLTATATDTAGNTSEFSFPFITNVEEIKQSCIANGYWLQQNYPNPFNLSTEIHYGLPHSGFVSLKIFNLLGQEVVTLVNKNQLAASYSVTWQGQDVNGKIVPSGIYYYRIKVGDYTAIKKLILIK